MGQSDSMPSGEQVGNGGSYRHAGAATEDMDNCRGRREWVPSPDTRSDILEWQDVSKKFSSLHLAPTRHTQQQPQVKAYKPNIALPLELSSSRIEDPEEEEATKTALKSIAPSFSVIHQRLLVT